MFRRGFFLVCRQRAGLRAWDKRLEPVDNGIFPGASFCCYTLSVVLSLL